MDSRSWPGVHMESTRNMWGSVKSSRLCIYLLPKCKHSFERGRWWLCIIYTTMPYQHLGALYELSVTDHHTFDWAGVIMHDNLKIEFSQSFIFSWWKKGNGELKSAGHIPIFVAKSLVECAWSKLCWLIGLTEVLVGHRSISSLTRFFMLVQVKQVMKRDESGKLKNPVLQKSWMLSQNMKVVKEEGLVNSIHKKTFNVYGKMGNSKTSSCGGTGSSCHSLTKVMTWEKDIGDLHVIQPG